MAKYNRKVIGSVCKSKDKDKPAYIKIRDDIALSKDQVLRLESKKFQLDSLDAAVAAGKLNGEMVESIKEKVNRIPDWVMFEIVSLEKINNLYN